MKSQEQANRPGNTRLVCTFCGKGEPLVNKIIAGPGVYICDQCVDLCNEILDGTKATEHSSKLNLAPGQSADLIKCSFCGKKQNQVVTGQIIIGQLGISALNVLICAIRFWTTSYLRERRAHKTMLIRPINCRWRRRNNSGSNSNNE